MEERLRELGAHPHQETVEEHAARTAREIGFQERQERYLWDVGAREAVQQFELLEQEIKRLAGTIKQSSGISLSAWKERYFHDTIYVTGLEKVLSIFWHSTSSNYIKDAYLHIALWSQLPPGPGRYVIEDPIQHRTWRFKFGLLRSELGGWIATDTNRRSYSTNGLAEHLIKLYLEQGSKKGR